MRIGALLIMCILTWFPLAVSAESFDLSSQEQVYACNSKENIEGMLKAASADDYFDAVANVLNYENNACPMKGPFNDDRLYGTVVTDEKGELNGGYDRIVIVRWRFEGGERNYYSLLARSNFGIWHDAIDVVMEMRTTNGIIDFFSN